ncbi:sulfatase [Vineibacter terrae]|uniref:Sulfatase n=1 Tax=Vineibacter terrae TaxID=2586908 RepID=A0A5C8PC22_9HYPH|nr:sulfatase-like hydrolase/transferase [Vineibacter terrae]TXL71137.1 sulfatase [Vineibacter terrae]
MGRKILFITTDQQRYDALGCNGGKVARTPVVDRWAAEGIRYTRAHAQSVVCMPARATMSTGQHVRTHGVWMNGVPLPADAPSVARHLHESAGYRTALFGKAHFEPFLDPQRRFYENRMATLGETGPHRGFERMELAAHTGRGGLLHYPVWLAKTHPDAAAGFYPILKIPSLEQNAAGGGDTGAIQVQHNPIARSLYHTDWVADRAIAWLDSLPADADWFCWVSFPDPHHPWDPPQSEIHRHRWQDEALPANWPATRADAVALLRDKPKHWLDWYEGRLVTNFEAPPDFVPASVTADQLREINALTHVENELIDEVCGRVWAAVARRGWGDDTDVIFTTDHGELQGDYGLLFKGPYHVDSLMRLPFIWRPATSAGVAPATVDHPVGQIDLAPTFCAIAGLEAPQWMQSRALPTSPAQADAQRRERIITEWDSEFKGITMHLRTIYRDGLVCTVYEQSTLYPGDGSVGELYDCRHDPLQRRNLWTDPAWQARKKDLIADLYDHLPPARSPRLEAVASV